MSDDEKVVRFPVVPVMVRMWSRLSSEGRARFMDEKIIPWLDDPEGHAAAEQRRAHSRELVVAQVPPAEGRDH
jgi:hypothetical protein